MRERQRVYSKERLRADLARRAEEARQSRADQEELEKRYITERQAWDTKFRDDVASLRKANKARRCEQEEELLEGRRRVVVQRTKEMQESLKWRGERNEWWRGQHQQAVQKAHDLRRARTPHRRGGRSDRGTSAGGSPPPATSRSPSPQARRQVRADSTFFTAPAGAGRTGAIPATSPP